MKKLFALLVSLCMLVSVCACAQAEWRALGNEIAGYLYTDVNFYNFISIDLSEEEINQLADTIGWCQYQCVDDSPMNGTIVTMQGFTSHRDAGMEETEYVEAVINLAYNQWAPFFVSPGYQIQALQLTEETTAYMLLLREEDEQSEMTPMMAVILVQPEGNYGMYLFENFTLEGGEAVLELLTSFEACTMPLAQ